MPESEWICGKNVADYLQEAGMPAPLSIPAMILTMAGLALPCALQNAAACFMYVALGSGAFAAFCASAAQHAEIETLAPPPDAPLGAGGAEASSAASAIG